MAQTIDLFTIDDFSSFGEYADQVVAELNQYLKDEAASKTSSSLHSLPLLKKDILSDPSVYLSADLMGKVYLTQNSMSNSIHPTPK